MPAWGPRLDDALGVANISDLLHAWLGALGCCLFGAICVRWHPSRDHPDPKWLRMWVAYCIAFVPAELVASDFGARQLPGSVVYQGLTTIIALSVGVVILYTTRKMWRLPMITIWVVGLAVIASAVITIVLMTDSAVAVQDRYDGQLAAFSVPILLAVSLGGFRGWIVELRHRRKIARA
ncbi:MULTISPECIES: hypothetical protein [Nocardia]|uniref:hypothetical protein n=1 Tax=Nocardia TaxID=1817 RepID=UPI000D6906FD|nr:MULTISPECIES: hypothetical protein [Nocardia]